MAVGGWGKEAFNGVKRVGEGKKNSQWAENGGGGNINKRLRRKMEDGGVKKSSQ